MTAEVRGPGRERVIPGEPGASAPDLPDERLLDALADVALATDGSGRILRVRRGSVFSEEEVRDWPGMLLAELVTREGKGKVGELLADAARGEPPRARQVTFPLPGGRNVPVGLTAIGPDERGTILIAGKDLEMLAQLQQRLIEAQQAMERDYWKLRQTETRYRLLFQRSSEAVLLVEASSLRIADANPAAAAAFRKSDRDLVGQSFTGLFEASEEDRLGAHVASLRSRGTAEDLTLRPLGDRTAVVLSSSLIRQDSATFLLAHIRESGTAAAVADPDGTLGDLVEELPDAFVMIDTEGTILTANQAFVELAELPGSDEAVGEPLGRWLGRPGADLTVLLGTLRAHGVVRLFATSVRGQLGGSTEVELSAVASGEKDRAVIGIVLRDVGRRLARGPEGAADLSRAVEQLTNLVGRVSLRSLVQDTVGLVERHFVEAALELTGDNRTAAAELLGLSRQSLYTKLRRYNLGGDVPGEGAPG